MSDRAATVILLPLSVVESNIWDVTSWSTFLEGVDWVERTSHERYVVGLQQGRRVHEVPVAVRWHPREHRVTWRELTGPTWRGEIRLTALNGRRTRITLQSVAHPRTLLGSLSDLFGGHRPTVEGDLYRLTERLAQLPVTVSPAQLAPARRIRAASPAHDDAPDYVEEAEEAEETGYLGYARYAGPDGEATAGPEALPVPVPVPTGAQAG